MDWQITDGRPVWLQLKEQIAMGILTGKYPQGSRLPSVRELAMDAGVNPNTMQRALTELERDGLAHSMGTMGRVVTENTEIVDNLRSEYAKTVVQRYLDGMKQLGYSPAKALKVLEERTHE
ncbi:MAG: GntR family transcriptional regulator [Oscillospiraceae bacterium]|nr:GntR family transcriptional regulator [Oscillospiraceae bacterium]